MNSTEHYEIITGLFIVLFLVLVLAGIELITYINKDFSPEEPKQ